MKRAFIVFAATALVLAICLPLLPQTGLKARLSLTKPEIR